MTGFLSEWKHIIKIVPAKLETKHFELIAIAQTVELLPELETKHSEPIVNAPPVELLSERKHIMPVKMEAKRSGPIATSLPVEDPYQKSSRGTPNT